MTIEENTITLAIDLQGGMCDRLMLGTQGIINNAKATLECWKYNAPDDEDIQEMKEPDNVYDAIAMLVTDNFHIEKVKDLNQIRELLKDKDIELDLNNIEFTDNVYNIY